MRHLVCLALVLPLPFLFPLACDPVLNLVPCEQIPEHGCPIYRGGSCKDPSCAGLYDCVDGIWRFVEDCSADGGGFDAGADADSGLGPDACEAIVLDHTGEKAGCKPDLQNPDCPAAAAETCVTSACLTDCIDFYLCTANGWSLVAYCTEEGQIVISP